MDTKEILSQAIGSMLEQIVELSGEGRRAQDAERYRERARKLLQEVRTAEKALGSISAPANTGRFASFKRAIEAILVVLEEAGHALTEDEIVKALCDGGFRGAAPGTALVIGKSLRSYLMGTGRKTTAKHPDRGIKKQGDLIGIASWGKDRFR